MEIWVSICENNDWGKRSGYVTGFQIDEFYFEAHNIFDKKRGVAIGRKQVKDVTFFRFDGLMIPYQSTRDWLGNMAWNGYKVSPGYALLLLNYLMTCGKFQPIDMWDELTEKVKKGERITAIDINWSILPDEIPEAIPFNPLQYLISFENQTVNQQP